MAYTRLYCRHLDTTVSEMVNPITHPLSESKKPKLSEKKIQKLINLRGGR